MSKESILLAIDIRSRIRIDGSNFIVNAPIFLFSSKKNSVNFVDASGGSRVSA